MTEHDTLTNPFPGLRPFESNEEHLFFGRDGQSDELLRRLRRSRFLAVLGTSGSGKSSLVRAGLLPSLYGGLMTKAGSDWRVALFRPGHDPIGNLAQALNAPKVFGGGEDADLQRTITEATLRRSALGLVEAARQARMPANENLLVVVDQFEEIFRFKRTTRKVGPEDEAAAFIKLLLEAKRQNEIPIYIVITMRSDFLGDCAQFRDLPEAINEGQYLIPRMTRDQRREAIMGPIAVGGGEISPRLVNRLLNDVGDNPDHLPILQHAMMRTWDFWIHRRRDGEPLDLSDYESVGAMSDALSLHADEAYNELPDERSRIVAEKLFKSLTEKGPDNREIRRPTRVKEICDIADASEKEVIAVIERFRLPGRSFLMPPTNVELGSDSLIDISHESLIRGWERLRKWVNEEARSAQIYRRLAETAALHKEGRAGLWHDPDLALALNWRETNKPNAVWAQHYHPDFDAAMDFLTASKEARETAIAEKERQRRREIRRTRLFSLVLGIAFLISLGFGAFAIDARNKAYEARNDAVQQRNKAETARNDAETARNDAVAAGHLAEREKQRAQQNEERALKSEEQAQTEKKHAEQAALIAEQRRKEAQVASERAREAQEVAEQRRKEAKRAALDFAWASLWGGKQNFDSTSNVNTVASRLIELSSPEEAAYWRNFNAAAYTERGRHELSREESTKVLDMFGDNLQALTNKGYMNLILKQPENALRDFQRARDLDPHNSLNYLNMGVTEANLKDYDAATKSLVTAIEWYRPLYFDGVFESEVSPDITTAAHRTVIFADGNAFNTALHYELANIAAFKGAKDFEARLAEADQHSERTKPSVEGYLTALNWGWLQTRRNPDDYGALAAQAYLWSKANYQDWSSYYYLKFQCEHKQKKDARYNELATWVNRQLATMPKELTRGDCSTPPASEIDPGMMALEAQRLASIGRYDDAITLLNGGIQNNPNNIELLLSRARYRKWRGDWEAENSASRKEYWDGSKQDFATALKLAETEEAYKPYVYLMWAYFGRSMHVLNDDQRASFFKQALDRGPASADALSELSDLVAKNSPAEAVGLLERSLKLEQSADSYYKLAKLQNDIGRYKEAFASIKTAISLRGDNPEYYRERERAEKGLNVGEIERKRHLAASYVEMGDTMLRQLKTSEANKAYNESLRILSEVAGKDNENIKADILLINSRLARLREVARTVTVPELTSCRILTVKGSGPTREVVVDRGRDDGLTEGGEGGVWSIYSKVGEHERKVQKIGSARVIGLGPESATVAVTMDNPNGDGLVQPGDMVEVRAKVPVLLLAERSILWRLAKYHINFTSEDDKSIFDDYRTLYDGESEQIVDQAFDAMVAEIKKTAEVLAARDVMKTKLTEGRFKDKTLREAMQSPTRQDLLDFLNYVMKYPATHYGKDEKIGRAWGTWVLQGTPQ